MEAYAAVLNYAIPGFFLLILLEYIAGVLKGENTLRSMDAISSLSSGLTDVLKDVLGLTVVIVGYKYMVTHLAIFEIESHWWVFVIAFIGKDFAGYWRHRISHSVNIFWNEHIIHHSSEEFNLACALRQSISMFVSFWAILYLPLAILGVPAEVIAVVAPLQLFAQFWYHTRLIKRMGFLEYIIVTPSHHRVHHSINPEYLDKNFGQIFILWDKLFGTFQEELETVPAVYGVKRAVKTWNPFLINFMHLWLLIKDAWRTQSWWDKLRIWFMPTGWRPVDVVEKYPVEVIKDVYSQEKYSTKASLPLFAWAWTNLIFSLGLLLFLFNSMKNLEYSQMLWYGAFIYANIFAYTTLMDRSKHAWWLTLFSSGLGLFLFFKMDGWFGLSDLVSFGDGLVLTFLIFSVLAAIGFTIFEFRNDKVELSSTA